MALVVVVAVDTEVAVNGPVVAVGVVDIVVAVVDTGAAVAVVGIGAEVDDLVVRELAVALVLGKVVGVDEIDEHC